MESGRAGLAGWTPALGPGLAVMVTLTGCGTPVTPVASPGIPSESAQSGGPGPGATVPGPDSTTTSSPAPRPANAPPCGTGDLTFVAENAVFAINRRELQLRATNHSSNACAVSGRPILHLDLDGEDLGITTLDHLDGRTAPVAPRRDGAGVTQSGGSAGPGPDTRGTGSVVLLPGESSVSVLQWREQQWATESHVEVLRVELDGGAGSTAVASWGANLPSGSSPIRVDAGDPLAASAWSEARTGPIPGGG